MAQKALILGYTYLYDGRTRSQTLYIPLANLAMFRRDAQAQLRDFDRAVDQVIDEALGLCGACDGQGWTWEPTAGGEVKRVGCGCVERGEP